MFLSTGHDCSLQRRYLRVIFEGDLKEMNCLRGHCQWSPGVCNLGENKTNKNIKNI